MQRRVNISACKFSKPQNNLPAQRKGTVSSEARFTIAFAETYLQQFAKIHPRSKKTTLALVREIPVNGFGIADLLAVAWTEITGEVFSSAEAFAEVAQPTCRAFEMKLSHWQKAISQASRYRNFAHQAIVVVPPNVCNNACKMLETFKKLRVGIWSFNMDIRRIEALYTPRPQRPLSNRYWYQSLAKSAGAPKSALPIREKA